MSEFNEDIEYDHDEERQTFDAIMDDERVATLEYRSNKEGKIFLTHTEVTPPAQGKGIGEALVKHVFDYIDENGMRMIPSCPFVKAYLRKNPEYKSLVASGIRIT